jgi:hypothetical protein
MPRTSNSSIAQLAAAAAACAMGFLVLRYVVELPDDDALREFLVVTGMIAVSTAIVFGVVIPRALSRGGSGGAALTLSLLGLLLSPAYWSAVPPVLAIGGIVLAQRTRETASPRLTRAAILAGVVGLVIGFAVLIANGVANS